MREDYRGGAWEEQAGYFVDHRFAEPPLRDLQDMGAEIFLWKDSPFAAHVRLGFNGRVEEAEKAANLVQSLWLRASAARVMG